MVKDRIREDSVAALKAGDNRKVAVLRFLVSLLDKKELSMPVGVVTEEDMMGVLRKEMKHKEEAREMFLTGKRDDLVAEVDYEITVLKEYLPTEVSEEKIREIVVEVIKEKGSNFGMVMGETMKRLGGSVGGDKVLVIVKACLT